MAVLCHVNSCKSKKQQQKKSYYNWQIWKFEKVTLRFNASLLCETFCREVLRRQLFLCFWLSVSSHDAMNPPTVVFE